MYGICFFVFTEGNIYFLSIYIYILVGGFNPSEKYELVCWNDYSQYMEK